MNFKMIDKRRLISCFQSTNNEIALDILSYKLLNVSPDVGNYAPRPTKSLKYSQKIFFKIVKVFWIYFLGYIFFLKQFFSYLIKRNNLKQSYYNTINKTVGLSFSNRSLDIINEKNCNALPDYWIIFPWTDRSRVNKSSVEINIFAYISFKDLCKAYFFSIYMHRRMMSKQKYKKWILQSYTSFEWFTIRLALEKIEADFFMAQHFDRWAVMMDGIIIEQQRSGLKSSLSLVQHGLVSNNGEEKLSLSYKLSKIKRLYLYSKNAEDYFKESILSENINNTLEEVIFYDNLLTLSKVSTMDRINVLFVGHSVCLDLHIFILNRLKLKYNFESYYKPHPTEKISKLISKQSWTIINDKHFFPEVDFLITYPSTLINEYSLFGINSVVHPIDLKMDFFENYLEELEKEIMSCYIKKNINLNEN